MQGRAKVEKSSVNGIELLPDQGLNLLTNYGAGSCYTPLTIAQFSLLHPPMIETSERSNADTG